MQMIWNSKAAKFTKIWFRTLRALFLTIFKNISSFSIFTIRQSFITSYIEHRAIRWPDSQAITWGPLRFRPPGFTSSATHRPFPTWPSICLKICWTFRYSLTSQFSNSLASFASIMFSKRTPKTTSSWSSKSPITFWIKFPNKPDNDW